MCLAVFSDVCLMQGWKIGCKNLGLLKKPLKIQKVQIFSFFMLFICCAIGDTNQA